MAFYTTTPLAGFDPTATFSSLTDSSVAGKSVALGTEVTAMDGNGNTATFRFVQAEETITQYDFVGIDENNEASPITAAIAGDGWDIGVAQVAVTDTYYFWAAMRGNGINGRVDASCAADTALYTTGTAGVLSSTTSTSGTKIDGVVAVASAGTSATNVEIIATYPRSSTF